MPWTIYFMYHSGCPAAQGPAARHAMQQAMALDCQVPKSSASLNALSSAHTYVLRNMGFKHHLQMMIEHAKIAVTSSMHGHRISRAQCCTCLSISACITVALQHMQLVAWLHGHVCHNIQFQIKAMITRLYIYAMHAQTGSMALVSYSEGHACKQHPLAYQLLLPLL